MGILDRAKAHYNEIDRGRLEVPEWGENGKPLIVTWTPVTAKQHAKIYSRGLDKVGADELVTVLIVKAEDENGEKLFQESARPTLTNEVDLKIVSRIANAILGPAKSVEDAAKN